MSEARSHEADSTAQESNQVQFEARTSCVVVVESQKVIGILTERDVVRLYTNQSLLDEMPVSQVMTTPVLTLRESVFTDLYAVINVLQQNHIRHLPIVDDQDDLVGLVTHETLQQVWQPANLLGLLQREQVVAHLATQIRSSLSLQTILETAVEQIHQALDCDRVGIWKFEPDLSTVVVAESTNSSRSLLGNRVWDECYQQRITEVYREGYVRVVPDIYTTEMSNCHREFLISLQTRAKVLLPLFCGKQLWGLLNVSESHTARDWQADEIDLLRKLATQLTIAIQQAATHEQLQAELQERQQAETLLQIKNNLLARVAAQDPLTDTLNHVCTTVEGMLDGAICSVLLLDSNNQLRDGAAPGLPDHYRRQVDGIQVGEGSGSCGTAVHRRERVIVADVANDPLWQGFKDLALTSGLQACWSNPIVAVDQSILGTFAIYYREVRSPRADEIALVDNLVHIVMLAIQRHQNELTLKQTNQRLQEAQRIANLGHWEQDLQQNTLYWGEEVFRIFELDPQTCCPTFETFWNFVPSEDRDAFNEAYDKHLCDRQPFSIVYRLQMPDGRIKYVRGQCETIFSADSTPLISRGTVQDITQQQEAEIRREQAEASLRQVIEGTAAFTGEDFFPALVRHIAEALGVRYVSVSHATSEGFQVLAFFADGELCPPQFLPFDSVPCCYQSLQTGGCCHPAGIQALYPGNTLFTDLQVESYLGVRLHNAAGEPTGNLCILHDVPLADPDWTQTMVSIFAARAGAELDRLLTAQALEQLNAELEERVLQRTTLLAEREARYRGLMEGAADAILLADLQGNILEANQKAEALFGYPLAELTTLHFTQLHPAEALPRSRQAFAEIAQKQRTQVLDEIFQRPDGTAVPVDITATVIELNGETLVQGIFRDISKRKVIERALQESQQFLQTVLDTVPLSVFWKDRSSNYLGANQRFLNDAALSSASELVGKTDFDMPWGCTEAEVYRADDRAVIDAGEAKLGIIETLHRQEGTEVWLETNKLPLRNLAGDIIGILGTYQNITDRKQEQAALQQKTAELDRFFSLALDLLCIATLDGHFVRLNHQWEKVLGYPLSDLEGSQFMDFVHPEDVEITLQSMKTLEQGEDVIGFTNRYRCWDNSYRWIEWRSAPRGDLIYAAARDITDRKQAEIELQDLTSRLTLAVRAGNYGIWEWDLVNHALWDDRVYEIYGLQDLDRAVTYQEWRALIHPDDIGGLEAQFETALHDRDSFNMDVRFWRTDGELRWVQIICKAAYDAEGNPVRVVGINCDITDRKAAEMLIHQNAERETLLREITQLILQQSLNLDEILASVTHQVTEVLKGDRAIIFQLYPDGRSQIVEEAVSDGLPCLRDKHWDNEVWSQDVLDHYWQGQPRIVPDVMDDRWTGCLVEYSIEGHIQSKIVAPILQEMRSDENHRWVSPCTSHKLWGVLVIHACTEKRIWHETEAQLLQQIANQLAIAIQQTNLFEQLQQELAERQQTQKQLTKSNYQLAVTNQELARATRLKDEFLANMSHELRTPLNAILGMSEVILEEIFGRLKPKQKQYIEIIQSSGQHLLNLINDILDVVKIASGQITLEYSHVAVEQMCSSSLAFIAQQALNKRIQLETNIQPWLPDIIVDEIRIRQVLLNLLTNAVKFTPAGGTVTLTVSLVPQERHTVQPAYLRIAIADTGIGIAPENIPKLFHPFVQIDGALNRQQTGTGLGLALVKQIVELHGGQVEMTSKLEEGSCFTVLLPYGPQAVPTPHAANSSVSSKVDFFIPDASDLTSTQSPLILIAEDNLANVTTLSSYLEAKGYRLLIAHNGQEAIDLAISHHPNVILMDVQMPGVDGLEAMKKIRQQERLHEIPIIALTALAMKGDEERCLAAGADYYLSKPIKLKQLSSLIQELL